MASYGESNARDLVTRFIDSIGIHDEHGVVPFVRSWSNIAGRDVAAHSQVLDIKNGALVIGVDHPAWLQRLHMNRDRIVATVKREFPALGVRYLHMTVIDHLDPTLQPSELAGAARTDHTDPSSEATDRDAPANDAASAADEDAAFQDLLMRLKEAVVRKNRDQ